MAVVEDKIKALLEEKFLEDAFSDCFLVDLKLHAHNKLDVFLDSDFGISFEQCQRISRYLEHYLDEEQWLGEKYVLEVSSPGVSRPLMMQRQYPRNIGRKVEVMLKDGDKRTGILKEVDEGGITLEEKIRIKEGKRKKTEIIETEISFSSIEHTKVKVTF
ncbi:MAG: ribosome assembly cofactor RimP [Phaeodactylibacter sp.]|uniref:ribosome assembly cofactor RimP n=1 Tax=Phaeodactylibacter sp. TaxID=1940289 RepID=UPI0032EB6464